MYLFPRVALEQDLGELTGRDHDGRPARFRVPLFRDQGRKDVVPKGPQSSKVSSANGRRRVAPAALTTASTRPTFAYISRIDAGSEMSTDTDARDRLAETTSCLGDKAAKIAQPIVPVAPTTRMRFLILLLWPWWAGLLAPG